MKLSNSKKSLEEIKQYLRIHNLIKIGTSASEDVLRQTYENALSGDIHNKSSKIYTQLYKQQIIYKIL